jgi:hypothetical protein
MRWEERNETTVKKRVRDKCFFFLISFFSLVIYLALRVIAINGEHYRVEERVSSKRIITFLIMKLCILRIRMAIEMESNMRLLSLFFYYRNVLSTAKKKI